MPKRIPRPCRKCGCAGKTTESHGYCEKHLNLAGWGKWQQQKGTAAQRGYGSDWRKLRKVILDRDGHLCQSCLQQGIYTTASHVDHIRPKAQGGTDNPDNLQSLCKPCHDSKTARERHAS